jgi:serine/threonine-protein kinase
VGRYSFHDEIASGGMGAVYFGKLLGPRSFAPVVAIKVLHPQLASEPEFVKMFFDEARLAARIRHTNVVPVIDVHDDDGELFLVLEYVHGESLSKLISLARKRQQEIPLAIASTVVCDVLRGLHAAHEAKSEKGEPLAIVHRDVSPQNVIVGVDGVSRVLDFGIAKAAGRLTTTREGQVKGKFAYMAPEQLRGEEINRQADVHAAAVVLWELLTGQRLFAGDNEGNIVARVLFAPIATPSSIRNEISPALDAVVMRGLARERADRFATAREMELALRAVVPPASPDEVGAWVTGLAFESLEARAEVVARLDAETTPKEAPAATTAEREEAVTEVDPKPKAISRRTLASLAAAAVASCVIAFAVVMLARPNSDGVTKPADLPSGNAPATTSASSAPETIASAAPVSTPSALPDSTEPHAPGKRRGSPTRAAPHASTPKPDRDCKIRNADGTIGFDTNCLRARAP